MLQDSIGHFQGFCPGASVQGALSIHTESSRILLFSDRQPPLLFPVYIFRAQILEADGSWSTVKGNRR